ncbi:rod shape-determining protein [Nonomuraea sp. NPDC000554]|uniref:rod shape-determining protein n=1 Tax=Nonomuraea sp. NPDC000554 TaxID=3154259 RepID=UPI00331D2057
MTHHQPSYAALDLGTARTRSLVSGSVTIAERASSVPARPRQPGRQEPEQGSEVVWPILHGMVANMAACHRLAHTVLRDAMLYGSWPLERVLVGVPVAATRIDRLAVKASVSQAARCPVVLVEEPLAAAVGCGLDITGSRPRLLLDVGAGIIEAVALGDSAITDAGAIQITASPRPTLPAYALDSVTDMVADLLRRLPAQQRPAARANGLLLTGGGARDPRLARHLCAKLRVSVTPALEPAHATIRGLARLCLLPALAEQIATPAAAH